MKKYLLNIIIFSSLISAQTTYWVDGTNGNDNNNGTSEATAFKTVKKAFNQRVRDSKRKAIEENIKKAKETGNKLTQTITEDGDLVGVGVNTIERRLENAEDLTSADIRKELFEGDNIRTKEYDAAHPGRRHPGAQPLPTDGLNTIAEEMKPFDNGELKPEYKNQKIDIKK